MLYLLPFCLLCSYKLVLEAIHSLSEQQRLNGNTQWNETHSLWWLPQCFLLSNCLFMEDSRSCVSKISKMLEKRSQLMNGLFTASKKPFKSFFLRKQKVD